jgi:hypothetical protein
MSLRFFSCFLPLQVDDAGPRNRPENRRIRLENAGISGRLEAVIQYPNSIAESWRRITASTSPLILAYSDRNLPYVIRLGPIIQMLMVHVIFIL